MLPPIEAIKTINVKITFAALAMSRPLPFLTYRAAASAAPGCRIVNNSIMHFFLGCVFLHSSAEL